MPEKTAPVKKKSFLDKLIDVVTNRDKKQEAKAADQKAAVEARAEATRQKDDQMKRTGEAKAKAARAGGQLQVDYMHKQEETRKAQAAGEDKAKLARAGSQQRMEDLREQAEAHKAQAATAAQHTYVVKSGDSLSRIAKELLGDANRWPEIFELNRDKIQDANLIYPGQELRLP